MSKTQNFRSAESGGAQKRQLGCGLNQRGEAKHGSVLSRSAIARRCGDPSSRARVPWWGWRVACVCWVGPCCPLSLWEGCTNALAIELFDTKNKPHEKPALRSETALVLRAPGAWHKNFRPLLARPITRSEPPADPDAKCETDDGHILDDRPWILLSRSRCRRFVVSGTTNCFDDGGLRGPILLLRWHVKFRPRLFGPDRRPEMARSVKKRQEKRTSDSTGD